MRCPTLQELPPPPEGKTGWPWTETLSSESPPLEECLYPRITVVTPSYNQAQFLEETLRSVLLQGYPNIEYIVIDGGSSDGSVKIIEKYQQHLAYWVSEADRGQSHAINKGFEQGTGDILCWLNSDDFFQPGTFAFVARQLRHVLSSTAWLIGASEIVAQDRRPLHLQSVGDISYETFFTWPDNWFPQQSTFWTRRMWELAGPLNEKLHYVMDLALWLSMYEIASPVTVSQMLSTYRYQQNAKCIAQSPRIHQEIEEVFKTYFQHISKRRVAQIKKELKRLKLIELLSQRLLNWVHDDYHNTRNYRVARHYLSLAIRVNPRLLTNPTVVFLRMKLLFGASLLNTFRKMKACL